MMSILLSAVFSNAGQTVTERQNLVSREMADIPRLLSHKTWHFVRAVPHSVLLIPIQLCFSRITLISCSLFFFSPQHEKRTKLKETPLSGALADDSIGSIFFLSFICLYVLYASV